MTTTKHVCSSIQEARNHLTELGFSIIQGITPTDVARELNIGLPVIPSYYKNENTITLEGDGFLDISAKQNAEHRGFNSGEAQELHVDGTLYKMGGIKTTLLVCIEPAVTGGESIVFQACCAYETLSRNLQIALQDIRALERASVSLSTPEIVSDAVFTESHTYGLQTRFSIDNTSTWRFDLVPNLDEAYEKLMLLTTVGSPLFFEFKLNAGEILVLANDKVSHGRRAFVGNRRMLRGIYTSSHHQIIG